MGVVSCLFLSCIQARRGKQGDHDHCHSHAHSHSRSYPHIQPLYNPTTPTASYNGSSSSSSSETITEKTELSTLPLNRNHQKLTKKPSQTTSIRLVESSDSDSDSEPEQTRASHPHPHSHPPNPLKHNPYTATSARDTKEENEDERETSSIRPPSSEASTLHEPSTTTDPERPPPVPKKDTYYYKNNSNAINKNNFPDLSSSPIIIAPLSPKKPHSEVKNRVIIEDIPEEQDAEVQSELEFIRDSDQRAQNDEENAITKGNSKLNPNPKRHKRSSASTWRHSRRKSMIELFSLLQGGSNSDSELGVEEEGEEEEEEEEEQAKAGGGGGRISLSNLKFPLPPSYATSKLATLKGMGMGMGMGLHRRQRPMSSSSVSSIGRPGTAVSSDDPLSHSQVLLENKKGEEGIETKKERRMGTALFLAGSAEIRRWTEGTNRAGGSLFS